MIVLITDGLDTCECIHHPWLDFNDGPAGRRPRGGVWLRTSHASPDTLVHHEPSRQAHVGWNAGLKAKAAYLALNGGDPDAGLGDIYVVGVAMTDELARGHTNHLAWMASNGRHPALYADRPETLRRAPQSGSRRDHPPLRHGEARGAAAGHRQGTRREFSEPRVPRERSHAFPGRPGGPGERGPRPGGVGPAASLVRRQHPLLDLRGTAFAARWAAGASDVRRGRRESGRGRRVGMLGRSSPSAIRRIG